MRRKKWGGGFRKGRVGIYILDIRGVDVVEVYFISGVGVVSLIGLGFIGILSEVLVVSGFILVRFIYIAEFGGGGS